ncbi:MAG: hypothetical protein ACK5KR_02695 [Breznakia sp.]
MKKRIWLVCFCFVLVACSEPRPKTIEVPSQRVEMLEKIKASEKQMEKMDYFKIRKVSEGEKAVCGSDGSVVFEPLLNEPWLFEVMKDDTDIAYKKSQKLVDEIQYRNVYYKQKKLYEGFTQLESDIKLIDENATSDYVILDYAIRAIDTNYFTFQKDTLESGNTQYTMQLDDVKGYNKAYPSDKDLDACSVVGDYVLQVMVVELDKDGNLVKQKVEETITYKQAENTLKTIKEIQEYQFYDFHVPNKLNFWFI